MDKKGVGGLLLLLVVGGIGSAMTVYPVVAHNLAVQEHEPTTATVQSTDIRVETDDDGDTYYPEVTYRYTVDGETYEEDNVFPGQFDRGRGDRSWAVGIVNAYSPGDEVTVYHSPRKRGEAYLRNDGWPGMWIIGAFLPPGAIIAGAYYIRVGFRRRKQRTLMQDTPTEKVQSLSMGPSEIKGTVVTGDHDPITAPFTDEECVVARYEIEEYEEDDDGGHWSTIEENVWYTPFYLDDGTGKVLVRPDGDITYDLDPDDWSTQYVNSGGMEPGPIRQYIEESSSVSFPTHGSGKDNDRKYRQNLIRTNEESYIFGTVQPRDDPAATSAYEDRVVVDTVGRGDALSEPMYLISDDTEESLINRRKWALWRLPVGIGIVTVGLAMALGMGGPLVGVTIPVLF